jgi:hypothetical protein
MSWATELGEVEKVNKKRSQEIRFSAMITQAETKKSDTIFLDRMIFVTNNKEDTIPLL